MIMKRIFWLHDESLSIPAQANAEDILVFLWHNDYFRQQAWSLNRLVFIYETLCRLPVTVYAGNPSELLQTIKNEQSVSDIYVQTPLNPLLKAEIKQVSQQHQLKQYEAEKMVDDSLIKPCKRFYAYWQQIEPQLFSDHIEKPLFQRFHHITKSTKKH